MNFSDAYIEMLKGRRMTRPCFDGYWYVNGKTGKLVIHLENGDEITEGDLTLTTQNTIAEDWDYYYEPLGSLSECSCEEEKLYSQAELDEAIANTKAEFSDALVELAELREFKAEYDKQVKIQQLNSEMDEIVANFNVNEDKVKELREKVLEGQYSMEKFELELYRNNQPIKNNFSKDDKKSTSLPIVDTEEKMSEVDLLFAKYGIPKK